MSNNSTSTLLPCYYTCLWQRLKKSSCRMVIGGILLAAFVGFFVEANIAKATVSEVIPAFPTAGETVTVRGSGFGDNPGRYGALCFVSTDQCYIYPSNAIKTWTDSTISFVIPAFVPSEGTLFVYKTIIERTCSASLGTCRILERQVLAGSTLYSFRPYIESITNEAGAPITGAKAGDKIIIDGYLFGTRGRISFGRYQGTVVSWDSRRIVVTAPEVPDFMSTMAVVNGAGVSSDPIAFDLYVQISRDTSSYLQKYLSLIGAPAAWSKAPKLAGGVTVAVIDTGINVNHPDFLGRLWINKNEIRGNGVDDDKNGYIDDYFGYNFISNIGDPSDLVGHGSMVAGIIAAAKDNLAGIAGIAPHATIMSLVACNSNGCNKEALRRSIIYAADNGARVINISIGGLGTVNDFDSSFDSAIQYAYDKGIVIVVAAGNGDYYSTLGLAAYGRFLNNFPNSPVCNDGGRNMVIGVSSVDERGKKSEFSDYGSSCIDISAPGEKVVSVSHPAFSKSGSDTDIASGTSYAAPQVAGAAALLLGEKPFLFNWEIAAYLRSSGRLIDTVQSSAHNGHIGVMLNVDGLLSQTSLNLPDIELKAAEVRDGKLVLIGTQYVNRDVTLFIVYTNDRGEEKIFQSAAFERGRVDPTIDIRNIPWSARDYKIFLERSGGRNKSPVLTLPKDFFGKDVLRNDDAFGQTSILTVQSTHADAARMLPQPIALRVKRKNGFLTIIWKRPQKTSGMRIAYEYAFAQEALSLEQLEHITPKKNRTTRVRVREASLVPQGIRYVYVRAVSSKKKISPYTMLEF